jgi:glyoxylase-like metal-dependent hydrolase (beta-lactamase superfamily II)
VKLLISDHAHEDHVGALAQIKRDTGARFFASAGDTWALTTASLVVRPLTRLGLFRRSKWTGQFAMKKPFSSEK